MNNLLPLQCSITKDSYKTHGDEGLLIQLFSDTCGPIGLVLTENGRLVEAPIEYIEVNFI